VGAPEHLLLAVILLLLLLQLWLRAALPSLKLCGYSGCSRFLPPALRLLPLCKRVQPPLQLAICVSKKNWQLVVSAEKEPAAAAEPSTRLWVAPPVTVGVWLAAVGAKESRLLLLMSQHAWLPLLLAHLLFLLL